MELVEKVLINVETYSNDGSGWNWIWSALDVGNALDNLILVMKQTSGKGSTGNDKSLLNISNNL